MAMTNLLSTTPTPLTFSLINLKHPSPLLSLSTKPRTATRKPRTLTVQSKGNKNDDSQTDPADRLISAVTYFFPFFDGIQYGKYVITQFTPIQTLVQPLIPSIRAFNSIPFNGFLVFITLYFVVVRNPNFSRYVRFNTMQAIILDTLLIIPDLVVRGFNPKDGIGLDFMMSLDSTVFLYLLVCLVYGFGSCLFGQVPRLPIVADAAEQVM
ncbi:protein TIC 20-v, chloroplastic-like [Rhododendron vialii]|uniref:protein TIC 20-v, chloroplastic-like n=1 Tax=Rhododendron vialii TaxID=182163 RepID=UPI00265DE418|nr:protein TIC 20-v, chloroplastic-like [Rhododendron vialii]